MTVVLKGRLICTSQAEADLVRTILPDHIRLTRAEPGCEAFDVVPADDPLVWIVEERFSDRQAFQAHQERALASDWGRRTAGIRREYQITGLD